MISFKPASMAGWVGVACLLTNIAASQASACPVNCFDFSNAVIGTEYRVGDVINIAHGTVEVQDFYLVAGVPVSPATQFLNITPSQIAGGAPNEVHENLVNMKLTPDEPVDKIWMNIGHNTGFQNKFVDINIEVNGEQIIVPTGFDGLDGTTIGTAGEVTIHTNIAYPTPGAALWVNGKLGFEAAAGHKIEYVTIGMRQGVMDNICISK